MMGALNFYKIPRLVILRRCQGQRLTVIQPMLARRQARIAREDTTGDGCMVTVSAGQHGRRRTRIIAAAARSSRDFRIGEGIWLTGCRLLGIVHFFHRIGADDRRGSRGIGLTGFPGIWAQRRRLLHGCGCSRTPDPGRAGADSTLPLQAQGDGAL